MLAASDWGSRFVALHHYTFISVCVALLGCGLYIGREAGLASMRRKWREAIDEGEPERVAFHLSAFKWEGDVLSYLLVVAVPFAVIAVASGLAGLLLAAVVGAVVG